MPSPNRSGGRHGGGYSRQRSMNKRTLNQRSSSQRRSDSAGRGGGRPPGGNDQMPLYLGLGAGAILLIGVLVFLLASGGGDDPTPVVQNPDSNPVPQPTRPTTAGGPAPEVMLPFSEKEKRRICELIENYDTDYDRAKELKDKGFRLHDKQDYDEAQRAWKEAFDLLTAMNDGANDLELQFGEGVWERIERFLPTQDRALSRWGRLRSDISKQLNTSR